MPLVLLFSDRSVSLLGEILEVGWILCFQLFFEREEQSLDKNCAREA